MQPYYQSKNICIYNADSRDIINILKADVCITDPIWPNVPDDYLPWKSFEPKSVLRTTINKAEFLKRIIIVMRSDSDPRFLTSINRRYEFFRCCLLPYAVPGYIGRKLGGDEIAYCFGSPIPSSPGKRVIPGRAPLSQPLIRNGHPMSRSLTHFRWLINWFSLPEEIIIDPFMGSGTTLLAARAAGRTAIGIEFEERYCEIAADRLRNNIEMELVID